MPFPESVKREAKQKAHYKCVICHKPFVEVHHIIPQHESGPDTLDNTAPLCGYCHDVYGGNPAKRKQIREMREFWWDFCANVPTYPIEMELNKKLDTISESLHQSLLTQDRLSRALDDIKAVLKHYYTESADRLSSAQTLSEVAKVSGIQLPLDSFGMATDPETGERGIPHVQNGRTVYL